MSNTIQRLPRIRILMWTRQARNAILNQLNDLLPEDLRIAREALESILDELAKNAIKANHKYLMIRDRIREALMKPGMSPTIIREMTDSICDDAVQFNEFMSQHPGLLDSLSGPLRKILDQEALWINSKTRYRVDKQPLTDTEKKQLRDTHEFKNNYRQLKSRRIFLEFRASTDTNFLWIEIINAAPILQKDLDRIYSKREEFKKHREAGTEYEFFLNHMDTSEGGSGLGYATIDTHLVNMGLDPDTALYILSMHNTNIVLNLDLNRMRERLATGKPG